VPRPPASVFAPEVIELPPPRPRRKGGVRRRAADPRSAFVGLRMTEAQKAAIKAEADRAGLSVTDYFLGRRRVKAAPQLPATTDPAIFVRILAELGKWGGNWNQLAHNRNLTGQDPAIEELRLIRAALWDIRQAVLKAVGLEH
jgi:hypothetical protein